MHAGTQTDTGIEGRILGFGRLLRSHGLPVSSSQISDALKAVSIVGLNPGDFKEALRCTLISDASEMPLFDRLFHLHFVVDYPHVRPSDAALDRTSDEETNEGKDDTAAAVTQFVPGTGSGRGDGDTLERLGESPALLLVRAVKEGDYALLRRIAELGVKSLGRLGPGDFRQMDLLIERAKANIGWHEAIKWLIPNF